MSTVWPYLQPFSRKMTFPGRAFNSADAWIGMSPEHRQRPAVKCAPGKSHFSAKRLKIRPNDRNFRPKSRNSSKSMGYGELEPLYTADHHSAFGGAQNAVFRAINWPFAAFRLQIRPNGQHFCPKRHNSRCSMGK